MPQVILAEDEKTITYELPNPERCEVCRSFATKQVYDKQYGQDHYLCDDCYDEFMAVCHE